MIKEGTLSLKGKEFTLALFSDSLIRAVSVEKKSSKWALRVLENLPLRTLRVVDIADSTQFEIRSPVVSLLVSASSDREKLEWIQAIERAVQINVQVRNEIRGGLNESVLMSPEPAQRRLPEVEESPAQIDYPATLKAGKACLLDPTVDNITKLKLYGLFKQLSKGDCAEEMPDESDPIARAKWHSWKAQRGKPKIQAKKEFALLVMRVTRQRCESEV